MNLKLTYLLNFFATESSAIVGHGVNTKIQSRGSPGRTYHQNLFYPSVGVWIIPPHYKSIEHLKVNPNIISNNHPVEDGASPTVSKRTVKRLLHHMGFGNRRPTRVLLLNARHQSAHLACARKHRDWSVEDWKRLALNDESRFSPTT
ncbi:HTH_Tnp_Tc3_2 domain-containing protein [Trichonephila clavipes]|nr:HTH_Tnp_Tc3_2 domain-containing protein [Trichonephila clavipes]